MRKQLQPLGIIALGGVLGAEARYGIDHLAAGSASAVPWATLTVNVAGCLLIGVLMVVLLELTAPHRLLRPFLGIGVLGGFTTFSAYAVEVQVLLDDGRGLVALVYLAATPVLAVAFCWAGAALARTVFNHRRGGHR
ncbi:MAG TPA: CrcB family protein [Jiangellaceae bacterium]